MFLTEEQFDLEANAVLPLGTANIDTASTANAVACFEKRFTISKCIGPVIAYE
jgi:hypothetical protein